MCGQLSLSVLRGSADPGCHVDHHSLHRGSHSHLLHNSGNLQRKEGKGRKQTAAILFYEVKVFGNVYAIIF